MANPDRANGFKVVGTMSGATQSGLIRSVGVSANDMFKGDMLSLASNVAQPAATNDEIFLGVAIGFGKVTDMTGEFGSAFNPDDLTTTWYDASAQVEADWRVFYVPIEDAIFEAQSNADLDLSIGDTCDLIAGTGSSVTGISGHEIATNSNADFFVVGIPAYPDIDTTLANTRYHVRPLRTYEYFNA